MTRGAGAALARGPLDAAPGWALALLALAVTWSIAPMGIATGVLFAATVAAMASRRAFEWPRTGVEPAAFGWALALLLAALFAQDRAGSLPRLTKALFPFLVGLVAMAASDRRAGERAVGVLLAATGVVAAIGIAIWAANGATFEGRARGLSGHYMTFAGQLLLELPVAIAIALRAKDGRWRMGAAAAAAVALVALAVTFTRSAWIGLFVSCGVILGFTWPPGIALLAVAGVAAFAFAPGAFRERLWSAFDPHHPWNLQRTYMWEAGARMFRDHPLTGVGLMDLHATYDRYRSPQSVERAGHLHNVYVQIAATMGAVGLAAFAFLVVSLFRATAHALRARGLGGALRLGVTAALAGFLVAGVFEWNFGDEELLYPLYLLVGLAWASRGWDGEER